VIGYGNPLRGDDALGPLAVQAAAALPELAEVDARVVGQLTPELAEPIAWAERVVFVDAACDGPPGAVVVRRLTPKAEPQSAWGHRCDPEELLRAALALYGRVAPAWLVSAGGVEFALGEGLSPPAAAALPQLAAALVEVLAADSA
jgi:hydrogenase maturation protease